MTESDYDLIVIGSGMSGLSAAHAAATAGAGRILLINGEDRLPYKRTQISKNLVQPYDTDAFALATADALGAAGIVLRRDRVVSLDADGRTLRLEDDGQFGWRALVLATGATSRSIFPGHSLAIRSAADGDRLSAAADSAHSAAVIGGGVLGIEVADQLRRRGLDVTILSRDPALMQR